jgi:hypothetical protein
MLIRKETTVRKNRPDSQYRERAAHNRVPCVFEGPRQFRAGSAQLPEGANPIRPIPWPQHRLSAVYDQAQVTAFLDTKKKDLAVDRDQKWIVI